MRWCVAIAGLGQYGALQEHGRSALATVVHNTLDWWPASLCLLAMRAVGTARWPDKVFFFFLISFLFQRCFPSAFFILASMLMFT